MKISLTDEEIKNILQLMWVGVKSPSANDSTAEFYVFIKKRFFSQIKKEKKTPNAV